MKFWRKLNKGSIRRLIEPGTIEYPPDENGNPVCGLQRQPKMPSEEKLLATTANLTEAITKIANSANGLTERQADAIVFKREDEDNA